MKENKKTAGKTAELTKGEELLLIANSNKLATINEIIDRVSDEDSAVRFIIFENGNGKIAVSSEERPYFDCSGKVTETLHDPQLFDLIHEYFRTRKITILETIYNIYQKGGDQ